MLTDNDYEWVEIKTLRGYPYRYRRPKMPRIENYVLESVFYLYDTVEDAKQGVQTGGTGFWVGVQSTVYPERSDVYAVTCKHIVKPKPGSGLTPAPVIRLNTRDGNFDVLKLNQSAWYSYEDIYPGEKHDIAIHEFGSISDSHNVVFLLRQHLLTETEYRGGRVGVGDEVYMIGRYIDHDGKQKNLPSVRFGNLSMMPEEKLRHWEEYDETSFVVEMRSLSGYSGSPVHYYVQVYYVEGNFAVPTGVPQRLLGIQWSQPPHSEYHREVGGYVKVYTGMSNVIPAWYIDRLLDWEVFKMHRKENDEKYGKEQKGKQSQLPTSAQRPPETFTEEDFEEALRKVSKRKPVDKDKPETPKSQ